MKCIRCGKQNDYRTRQSKGGACAACGGPFAFEPRKGDPLTDLAFQNAVSAVSDDGRLAWLERQLYYEVARRVRRKRLLHRLRRRKRVSIDHTTFATLLSRWVGTHGPLSGRLQPKAFAVDVRGPERAQDTMDYGFDRVVVCDSDDIVDVLLANGFHGDSKCAVLSASGYPSWAYDLLMPRFRTTPPTSIVALHDADLAGCRLAAELRSDARWFRGVENIEIVDAGLRPGDAGRFRGLYLEGSTLPDVLSEPVSVDEARWLSKHSLELEAVRPCTLFAVLGRALNRRDEVKRTDPGDGGGWFVAWGDAAAGDSDGGGDGDGDGGGDG